MHKSQEVIGLSVVHLKTGRRLGLVKDILFDLTQRFCGILLEDGGWIQRRRYIPRENIESIGRDAVVIKDEKGIFPFGETTKQWTGICSGKKRLQGLPVLLASGYELGIIKGVYFMEELGTLVGYELSDGWMNDLTEGRKILKASEPLVWGQDVLIAQKEQVRVQEQRHKR